MLNKQMQTLSQKNSSFRSARHFRFFWLFLFNPPPFQHFFYFHLSTFYTPSPEGNRLISKSLFIFTKTFSHFDILLILMNVPAPLENCRFNRKCSFNLYYAVLSVQGWRAKKKSSMHTINSSETMKNDEKAFYRTE